MTSLLLIYEQLYSQTSKLSKKLPTSDPLLSIALTVLQEKFFTLVGSQPGSLYLTEYYVNSPQSSFVTEELAKLTLLATTLGINTELFTEIGDHAAPQNMMIPQFPIGSISNTDYIYANHFASQYSYSVTLPYIVDYKAGVGNLYTNLQDKFRVGIRSGYMNDPGTNQIFLRTNSSGSSYSKYISFSLIYRSNHTTTNISSSPSIITSFGKDIIITICNDSRGITFLINGFDYFGPITSEMVSFDVTQPMGFYSTPCATTSNNNSILVTGYTNNIVPYIPTIKAIKGTAEFLESYYSLSNVLIVSGYSGHNMVMTPSTSYATFNMALSNSSSYKIGFRTSISGGYSLYMIVGSSYTFQIDYNGGTHTYDPGVSYNVGDTLQLVLNDTGIQFKVNGTDLIANDGSFNIILNNFFAFPSPSPFFFFIEIISNEGAGLFLPNFSYHYQYNPYTITPPVSEYITNGNNTSFDGSLLTFGVGSMKNIDYLISSIAYMFSTYSITLDENCDYSSPILFGLRSSEFGVSSPSLCFVKISQRTIYAPSGSDLVTSIDCYVNQTNNPGSISTIRHVVENPPSGRVITIYKGDDGISFELSGYSQIAYVDYADTSNSQYNVPMYFYATPRDTIAGEQYISVVSSGLS